MLSTDSSCKNHKLLFHGHQTLPKQGLGFTCLHYTSFENTVGKGEIACNEQFLLFPQCFVPTWRAFCHLSSNIKCPLQTLSVWKFRKFVVLGKSLSLQVCSEDLNVSIFSLTVSSTMLSKKSKIIC